MLFRSPRIDPTDDIERNPHSRKNRVPSSDAETPIPSNHASKRSSVLSLAKSEARRSLPPPPRAIPPPPLIHKESQQDPTVLESTTEIHDSTAETTGELMDEEDGGMCRLYSPYTFCLTRNSLYRPDRPILPQEHSTLTSQVT